MTEVSNIKYGEEKISEKIAEVTVRMQELIGAAVVSYYYSPELSIPIIRIPEFSQFQDRQTWEAVTFDLAKRSFEILGIPTKEPEFTPEYTVFTNQMQETQYSVVGYAYSLPIPEYYRKRDEEMFTNHDVSICLLIRKGKEGLLSRKEVKKQIQKELQEILVLLRNSEDATRVINGFLHFKYHGRMTREETGGGVGIDDA